MSASTSAAAVLASWLVTRSTAGSRWISGMGGSGGSSGGSGSGTGALGTGAGAGAAGSWGAGGSVRASPFSFRGVAGEGAGSSGASAPMGRAPVST